MPGRMPPGAALTAVVAAERRSTFALAAFAASRTITRMWTRRGRAIAKILFFLSWGPLPVGALALLKAGGSRAAAVALATAGLAVLVAAMGLRDSSGAGIWRRASLVGAIVGLAAGAFVMWAAWVDNPQGEFHQGATIHWAEWLGTGLSWFVPAYASALIVA
jgi:hypothetical protein